MKTIIITVTETYTTSEKELGIDYPIWKREILEKLNEEVCSGGIRIVSVEEEDDVLPMSYDAWRDSIGEKMGEQTR